MTQKSNINRLSSGHRLASGLSERTSSETKADQKAQDYFKRNEELSDIPPHILRQAWFNMAHLILPKGAKLANMGCGDGQVTYAMAKLHPDLEFIGIDYDEKLIKSAEETFKLPNLSFHVGAIAQDAGIKENSLDAIINSFVFHEV